MPRHTETIHVEAGAEEVTAACLEVLGALGWNATASGAGIISAREDIAGLGCRTSPSEAEISIEPETSHRTAVTIAATAPGIGPIPSARRLQRQVAALEARIRRAASL